MIKFNCNKCGQKLSVPETRAGKKGRCPNCKNIIAVPEIPIIDLLEDNNDSETADLGISNTANNAFLEATIEKDQIQDEPLALAPGPEKSDEYEQEPELESPYDTDLPPERKLPWLFDIFLYPICIPCLQTIGIIIVIPLLINLAVGLLGPFGFFVLVPGIFIDFILAMYFLWYLTTCIRDSAEGGIRAPETVANAPSLGELFVQLFRLLISIFIFAGPVGYYYIKTHSIDTIFWFFLAVSIFFLPIGLLAVTMFESIRGLNPFLLISSALRTHFIYLSLAVILWAIAIGVVLTIRMLRNEWTIFLSIYFVM
jgi:DNA-directed RNA polymerase subunit RPC12/RpoP